MEDLSISQKKATRDLYGNEYIRKCIDFSVFINLYLCDPFSFEIRSIFYSRMLYDGYTSYGCGNPFRNKYCKITVVCYDKVPLKLIRVKQRLMKLGREYEVIVPTKFLKKLKKDYYNIWDRD